MGFAVVISPSAREDLRECFTYISGDNPDAAERYCLALIDHAERIGLNPEMGRECPEFPSGSIRDIVYRSHRIVYRVKEDERLVEIVRFWHGARGYLPDALDT